MAANPTIRPTLAGAILPVNVGKNALFIIVSSEIRPVTAKITF
jgi:hypothetical protein